MAKFASLFSIIITCLVSIYPAIKASKLDTIKSLNITSWPLDNALKKIAKSKQGAMVFLTNNLDLSHITNTKNV